MYWKMIYTFKKRCFLIKNELMIIIKSTDINIEISIPITPYIGINKYNKIILISDVVDVIINEIFSLFIL